MPLSLQGLRDKTQVVDVYRILGVKELAGQLHVTYRIVGTTTPDDELEIVAAGQGKDAEKYYDKLIETMLRDVVGWDLMNADEEKGGEVIPLTKEAIKSHKVPSDILQDITAAIQKDKRPSK